ncbi:MAG: helix-turn-helix transcriptional regulator [Campylobacteraceae bacterium]|nr:helix-turn-helix transcriptional regulator [Campylobacteraceae bacterium]
MNSSNSFTKENPNLTSLGLQMYKVDQSLKKYVQSYWSVACQLERKKSFKIAPDGAMGLLINLGDPLEIKTNTHTYHVKKSQVVLLGIYENPVYMEFEKNCEVIGIRFNPAGASFFFAPYIKELFETILYLNEERLSTSLVAKTQELVYLLDEYLLKRFNKSNKPFDIMEIISLIEKNAGSYDIEELTLCANMSRRNLDRVFKKALGISLKIYARIIKIKYTRMSLQNYHFDTLTTVSYDSGYFDQSHFIKEFRNFMFETPKEYFLRKQKLSQKYNS